MVPFSFHQPLLKSRVMKEYTSSFWGRMEFGIRCFCPFLPSCFPYGHSEPCEKANEFAKIQVNPTKSNHFFYLAHGEVHGVDHRPYAGGPCGSHPPRI